MVLGLKLTLQSQITLYPLSIQKDKKNYIVEEPVSGDFFEMPKICIDAIERINEGQTLGDIEIELREKYPNEKVDMIEFGGAAYRIRSCSRSRWRKNASKKGNSSFRWIYMDPLFCWTFLFQWDYE